MGSPDFAVPSLKALSSHYLIAGVVTQPDRPAGRGRSLTPPPVKIVADQLGLPVIQPKRLREPEAMQQLFDWSPDIIIVAAFGQILRREVLELPAFGCVNVHASLLPRWRGAAPIQAAILHGDHQTGVTIMQMDPGIDTGGIFRQQSEQIFPGDTTLSLSERLADLGAELLIQTLSSIFNGTITAQVQDESLANYAPMLKKEDGELDFSLTALELERKIRAFYPWPGAFTHWQESALKVHLGRVVEASYSPIEPGKRFILNGYPAISTSEGSLVLLNVQPAGKKAMDGKVFLSGARSWEDK